MSCTWCQDLVEGGKDASTPQINTTCRGMWVLRKACPIVFARSVLQRAYQHGVRLDAIPGAMFGVGCTHSTFVSVCINNEIVP